MDRIKNRIVLLISLLSFSFYSIYSQARNATERACVLRDVDKFTDEQLFSAIDNTMNCSEISENGKTPYFYPVTAERLQILSWEFYLRLKSGRLSRSTPHIVEYYGDLKYSLSEFIKRGTGQRTYNKILIDYATSNVEKISVYLGQAWLDPGRTQRPLGIN